MEQSPVQNEKEIRTQQADKVVDFLDRIDAYEYVQSLFSEPGNKPSFEQFRDFLVRINGIARDTPISERSPDGEHVYIDGFVDTTFVPHHSDKEVILKKSYEALDTISPKDASFLLPAVINAVHLFVDGNGRTSRVVHALLSEHKDKEGFNEYIRTAAGNDGRYQTADINPSILAFDIERIVLSRHGISFKKGSDWEFVFPDGFGLLFASSEHVTSAKAKQFMDIRRTDQPYCFIAARDFLQGKNIVAENTIDVRDGVALSPKKMDQNLSDTDWDEIIARYYALKREHAESIVDIFVNPNEYKVLDDSMTLKEYFIKKIDDRLQENLAQ